MKKIICIILTGILVAGLCGCSLGETLEKELKDKDKYTAGNATITEKVDSIIVDWASGEVNLVKGKEDAVILEETYEGELPDDKKMQWWLDGTTLRVRYDLSVWSLAPSEEKTLTVTIPETLELEDLEIDSASAKITTEEVSVKNGSFGAASGDMEIRLASAEKAHFDAASGNINATVGTCDEIGADTASGKISLTVGTTGKIDADTASGSIDVHADEATNVSLDTASGKISTYFGKCPESIDIDSASGSVTIGLPKDAGCTVSIDTGSGDFNSQFPVQISGSKYVIGDGSGKINIDTASGDVDLVEN